MVRAGAGAEQWRVEHHTGAAAHFHDRPLPAPVRRSVWWFTVERPTIVLGSTQPLDAIDTDATARLGLDVARRHSGGGAVLLTPTDVTWVDVIIPAADPLWEHDVARAFDWLGEVWVSTLGALGAEDPRVHRGPLVRTRWSDAVCFAGLGRGEVTVGERKVLGISQRRTRLGARFQCALLRRWDPSWLIEALALSPAERERATQALADVAAGVRWAGSGDSGLDDLESTLLAHLPG